MYLTVAEAAARLGKTPRQIRYLLKQGQLDARKPGKSWQIDVASLDAHVAPGVVAHRERVADRVDAEVAAVTPEPPPTSRRRYSLTDMKAYQIAAPLLARCHTDLGPEHDATRLLRASLDHVARGCHRFERDEKAAAYRDARDAASHAVCALYLDGGDAAREIATTIEQELMATFAGLLRRLSKRRR